MKIIKPSVEILSKIDRQEVMELLERVGRTCYKSEDKITPESADEFIRKIIANGHEAIHLKHLPDRLSFISIRFKSSKPD